MNYEEAAGPGEYRSPSITQNLKGSGVKGVMCAHLPSTSHNTTTQLLSPEKRPKPGNTTEMTKNRNL